MKYLVTIDHTKVASDITDFVIYVDLADMPASFWSNVASGGGDIRVYKSDETTELAREVVSCDTGAETGELHLKYTGTLSSSTDTEIIIEVDGVSSDYATSATYGAENVWTAYDYVSHDGGANDSTSNGYTATGNGGVTSGGATGKLGAGTSYDGNDYFELSSSLQYDSATEATWQAWLKPTDATPAAIMTIISSQAGGGQGWATQLRNTGVLSTFNYTIPSGNDNAEGGALSDGVWSLIHFTYLAGGALKNYVDASNTATDSPTAAGGILGGGNVFIGARYVPDRYWIGEMDEIRLGPNELSSSWITTEHNNQSSSSTFYSIAEVETFTHVATLTIDHTKVSADITDYVTYVDLSDLPAAFWSAVLDGGGDIRIFKSDDTTELPREVVSCDTTGETGELYFKYSGTLSSSSDTVVHVYVNGTSSDYAVTDTYGRNAVWSDYEGVWHLNESTGSTAYDSAGNADGTYNGNLPNQTTGPFGYAQDFDGTGDYINIGSSAINPTKNLTISAWTKKTDDSDGFNTIVAKDVSGDRGFYFWHRSGESLQIFAGDNVTSCNYQTGNVTTPGTWERVVGQADYDNSYLNIWVNTTQVANQSVSCSSINTNTGNLLIGEYTSLNGREFRGQMKEVRISFTVIDDDQNTTEYNNQSSPSTFYSATSSGGGSTTESITNSLSYSVDSTVSVTKSVQYVIESTSTQTIQLSLVYDVSSSSSVTKSLSYDVLTSSSITFSLSYSVLTSLLVQKTVEYVISNPSSSTKTLSYSVLSSSADTKDLAYEITRTVYSREASLTLPSDDAVLSTEYSESDKTDVETDDGTRVCVTGTGYLLHQFKVLHENSSDAVVVSWNGQATIAPSSRTVYFQIYNYNSAAWETLDSDSTSAADTDFTLTGEKDTSMSDYYDGVSNEMTVRVYQ